MNIAVTKLEGLTASDVAAWQALQRANPDCDSPFLHYQFANCVSRVRDDVYVATLREQDEVLGFLPFQRGERRIGCGLALPLADHQGMVASSDSRKVQRELGPLRLEWHDGLTAIVDTMIQWKQQQLAAAGYRDLYALPWVRELIHQVLHGDSSDFAGRMATLLAGDKLLSIHLGIQSGHVLASWIPTYNPAYAAHSPGLLLHDQLFRQAPLEGIERVELGRGYNQLKRRFMSGATQVAMGALDRRFLHRMVRATWYRTRDLVYATPLRRGPLRAYRKLRNRLAAAASLIGASTRPLAVSSRFRRQPPRPTNGS